MSHQRAKAGAKAVAKGLLPSGCGLFIVGIILIVFAVILFFAQAWVPFIIFLILGIVFILIWPIFMRPRFASRASTSVHVYGRVVVVSGPIPNGGSAGWLVTWGLTMILLAFGVITPLQPYFLGSVNFLDLALQASISSLLTFPGAFDFSALGPWLTVIASMCGGFVAGLVAKNPKKGIAAGALIYLFVGIFLFFFSVLFLAFEVDLNNVWAFLVVQLTIRWADGLGLLSIIPPLLFGAIGGLVRNKKD